MQESRRSKQTTAAAGLKVDAAILAFRSRPVCASDSSAVERHVYIVLRQCGRRNERESVRGRLMFFKRRARQPRDLYYTAAPQPGTIRFKLSPNNQTSDLPVSYRRQDFGTFCPFATPTTIQKFPRQLEHCENSTQYRPIGLRETCQFLTEQDTFIMSAMDLDQQPQPYTFDLGHMLCLDTNPLPSLPSDTSAKETILASRAQQVSQALIHQLLRTCPITRSTDDGNLQLTLPSPETPLPREKSIPKEKEKSKWEKFAEKKGIKAKRREGKLEYDDDTGSWKPRYGYKGKKAAGGVESDWIVEVDDKKNGEGEEKGDKRARGKGDTARRNERIQKRVAVGNGRRVR